MKTPSCQRWLASLLFVTVIAAPTLVNAARPPLLRYRATAGTNAFSVVIEVRGDSGKESLVGNLVVSSRPMSSNLISLSFRGNLNPKRDLAGFNYSGRAPRWMAPISLNEGSEIQMDVQGRILRVSGDFPLPLPLGTVAQLFVPALPTKAETKWEMVEEVTVLDEPLGLGPTKGFGWSSSSYMMPYSYGSGSSRGMSAVVMVSRRTKCEIKSDAPTAVTIHKREVLDSPLFVGAEPRLSAAGEGDWVFDPAGGFLRSVEMEFQSLLNSEQATRRTTAKLKIQLLEGKEREAALAPLLNRPTVDPATGQVVSRKLTGDALQKVFEDLQSDDEAKRQAAAARLQGSELVAPPQALVNYLTNHLFSSDTMMKMAAVKVVADFGTTDNVPDLLRLLKGSDSFNRSTVIRGLGRLKDPRAIEPLVACIASGGSDAYTASATLGNFGPDAEDAVLGLLKERHTETKRAACGVLQKVGTTKSLEPLKEAVTSQDSSLSSAAGEAIRAIQARQ